MARDFAAIKNPEEVKDALIGARVLKLNGGIFTLEAVSGEVFRLVFAAAPVEVKILDGTVIIAGKTQLQFLNAE